MGAEREQRAAMNYSLKFNRLRLIPTLGKYLKNVLKSM